MVDNIVVNKVDTPQETMVDMVDNAPKVFGLTEAEKDVLNMITEDFLTVKQICLRRQCSRQAVYKILKSLKNKGAYTLGLQKVDKVESTCQPSTIISSGKEVIRLHGQEFHIKVLWQDHKYQELLSKSNLVYIDGNTIRLYKNAVEVYSGHSFFGENEQRATVKSLDYWKRFFIRLEHDLKAILVKPRAANIKVVNQHYARVGSEISESAMERGERIRVYAAEDGKLAFITDDSFGFKEDETVHPTTSKNDRKEIDKQVNDWRLNSPPTNSQLANSIMDVTKNQMLYAENIKSHIQAIQDLGTGVKQLAELIKELKGVNQ